MSSFGYRISILALAVLVPISAQTAWAAINLRYESAPVCVGLTGAVESEGHDLVLNSDRRWFASATNSVTYKYSDPLRPAIKLVPLVPDRRTGASQLAEIPTMPSVTTLPSGLPSLSAISGTGRNDGLAAGIGAGRSIGWKGSLGRARGISSGPGGSRASPINDLVKAIEIGNEGDSAVGEGTSNAGVGEDVNFGVNENGDASSTGDLIADADDNGSPGGNETGNGNVTGNADGDGNGGPAAAALHAPEPSSYLIWLGAGLAGTAGVGYARARRRN